MRVIIIILASLSFLQGYSQTGLMYPGADSNRPLLLSAQQTFPLTSSHWRKPWQLSAFSGVNAGYGLLSGGNVAIVSAPVGLQVTRRLNNNWYAFADMSAAPVLYSFNSAFANPGYSKSYPGSMLSNGNRFAISSSLGAGLLYVNEERTFSISGSIHVERNSYPVYPSYRTGMNIPQPAGR